MGPTTTQSLTLATGNIQTMEYRYNILEINLTFLALNDVLSNIEFWREFTSKLGTLTGFDWLGKWFERVVLEKDINEWYNFDIYLTVLLRVYAEYIVYGRLILLDPDIKEKINTIRRIYAIKLIEWLTDPVTFKLPNITLNAYKRVGEYIVIYITEPKKIIETAIELDKRGFKKRLESLGIKYDRYLNEIEQQPRKKTKRKRDRSGRSKNVNNY